MIGRVVSTKMANSATVLISRTAQHPLYHKTFARSKKYLVNTKGAVKEGDIVEIVKIRPISKNKHWEIAKIIGKSLAEINEEKLKAEAAKVIAEVMPPSDAKAMESEKKEEKKEPVIAEVKEEKKVKKEKK